MKAHTPLGRLEAPEDIANAYLYLASDEANGLNRPLPPFRTRCGHTVNHYDDRVLDALDTDTRYVWSGFTNLAGPPAGGGLDAWGIGWEQVGIYLTATQYPLAKATIEELEACSWPNVESFIQREQLLQRARYLKEQTDYAVVGRAVDSHGLLEQASQLRGMEQFMLDLALDESFATALIGTFYTMTLQKQRRRDRVHVVYSPTEAHVKNFAEEWDIPKWTTDMAEAINDPETDVVIVGLPNYVHKEAVIQAAEAGKAVLCTKPLARTAAEAKEILAAVEGAGVFHGYLEDLVYTPKMLKSLQFVQNGALGRVLWVRSRETHGGPHGAWFWDVKKAGGGAIIDMGCHCIEIARSFVGKGNRPVEVMCWADTLVHPVEGEDHGIGLIRFESGAIGQFEVSWAFRGGMDLRDEVSGTEGTIWINHFLRTGLELFTAVGREGYVSEKAEGETGWLFPVGDEVHELGYPDMFTDMLDALDNGGEPRETLYDGYVVNAIMDACYRSVKSKRWEPVVLEDWRGVAQPVEKEPLTEYEDKFVVIKEEHMPDGKTKLILKNKETNAIIEKVI